LIEGGLDMDVFDRGFAGSWYANTRRGHLTDTDNPHHVTVNPMILSEQGRFPRSNDGPQHLPMARLITK
jgi:hypothetical protein